jgi:protein-tyrosine-phosphatase
MSEPLRVLFVCTANICRSPVMELIARDLAGSAEVVFTSSGTHARNGLPMTTEMIATLSSGASGTSDDFRSRLLTGELLDGADLVLTAEQAHRQHILDDFPQLHRRVFTLGQFAAAVAELPGLTGRDLVDAAGRRRAPATPDQDVADPYRRGKAAAVRATGTITDMLNVIVPRLTGSSAGNDSSAPDLEG